MRIAGLQRFSTVDCPGKIAAVVFTQGCNLNCFYCHNRSLISCKSVSPLIGAGELLRFLESRRGLLDAVVVSGGEPTLQSTLERFLGQIRDLGFAVKIDTNGTRPNVL